METKTSARGGPHGTKPSLSICIPTYQRKKILSETLDSLIEVAKKCPGDIEICVSDNASTDGTFAQLKKYSAKHPFIRAQQNKENLGYDRNLRAAVEMARSEYCWAIGDDDTVVPKGVISLVRALKKGGNYAAGFMAAGRPEQISDVHRLLPKSEYSVDEFIEANIRAETQKTREGLLVYGFLPCYLYGRKALEGNFPPFNGVYTGWYHLSLFYHIIATHPKGNILVHHDPPIIYGSEGDEFARVTLPDRDIRLYTADRLAAITFSPVRTRLEEPAKHWLKQHSGYWYMVNILRLMFMRPMLKPGYYSELKKRVYSFGDGMEMPLRYQFVTRALKIVEHIPLLRDYLAGAYARRSRYAGRFIKYTIPSLREKGLLAETSVK